jgi:hypothetical protein
MTKTKDNEAMTRPQKEKVFIKKLDREVMLEFFTLADDAYLNDKYGMDKVQKALEELDAEIVLDIFWNQLSNDGKKLVASSKISQWDGLTETSLDFNDPVKKLKHIISGADELLAIWIAIISTKKKSIPQIDENVKKKVMGGESSQK